MNFRDRIVDKKRIVIKIGSSSLTHKETGHLDLIKLEVLIRELSDLRNQNKEVILVSSGAIMVGRTLLGYACKPEKISEKQACAAIGQAKLMMIYQKLFSEYNQVASQILMTKYTMMDSKCRQNAKNTFEELLHIGSIPIVNENDTVATDEIEFGDNDTLAALVAALIDADLLVLLSDIDGLFTDDPNTNADAKFIDVVEHLDEHLLHMGKSTSSSGLGTGGMSTKLTAAQVATSAGADMIIANGYDFHIIHKIMDGRSYGTLFLANPDNSFGIESFIDHVKEGEQHGTE